MQFTESVPKFQNKSLAGKRYANSRSRNLTYRSSVKAKFIISSIRYYEKVSKYCRKIQKISDIKIFQNLYRNIFCNLKICLKVSEVLKCNNRWGKCRWVGRSCRPSKIISLLRFESLLPSTWPISSNCNQFRWQSFMITRFLF